MLEAISSRLEAIASRFEAIASRLEAIGIRLGAIASGWRPSLVGWRPSQVGWRMLEAIASRLGAMATRLKQSNLSIKRHTNNSLVPRSLPRVSSLEGQGHIHHCFTGRLSPCTIHQSKEHLIQVHGDQVQRRCFPARDGGDRPFLHT